MHFSSCFSKISLACARVGIKKVGILVSKVDHALLELLWRHARGGLPCEITKVVSNHETLREAVENFGIPFEVVPVNKENKLIIDYSASLEFNTKIDTLESKNFKKVAIGNHKKDGYFRIAVELLDKPSKFDVDYKDEIVTITRKN